MNLSTIKPLNNYVLLKVKNDTSKIRFENGVIIWLDTTFNQEQHIPVVCEVIKVPERLVYSPGAQNSMPWDTDMELREGDTVIVDFLAYANSFWDSGEGRGFKEGDEEYFWCKYFSIFVAKRKVSFPENSSYNPLYKEVSMELMAEHGIVRDKDGVYEVICLNGFVLIENIPEDIKTTLIIPEYLKKKDDTDIAIVRYVGTPNRSYEETVYEDAVDLKSGDRVIMDKSAALPLEHPTHLTFFEKYQFGRAQRCFIFGKFEE